jgi:ADP-heptose:LPS heptosyltransferase
MGKIAKITPFTTRQIKPHKKSPGHYDRVKERTMNGKVKARIAKLTKKGDLPIKLMLYNNLCPGDNLAMTAAIECLHSQYPGRYLTDVDTFSQSIYDNNPWVTRLEMDDPEVVHLWTTYPLVNKTNQTQWHFLHGYVDWFEEQLGIRLKLEVNRPYIYVAEEEKYATPKIHDLVGRKKYWVISAGYKSDYTIKKWRQSYFQEVVDYFKGKITFVQIGLNKPPHHIHNPLNNVLNLIGKTDLRQLIMLCYNAEGGLGPITCIQHIFASFQKPYVVLHGAREPTAWTNYQTQITLSNIGTLPCCKTGGCWHSRVVKLNDGDKKDNRLCKLPIIDDDPIATCMDNIKPDRVIEAIESWYKGGILSYI